MVCDGRDGTQNENEINGHNEIDIITKKKVTQYKISWRLNMTLTS